VETTPAMYLRIESNRQIDHHRTAPPRLRIPAEPQQIKYDFNDQGYDFAKGATFTNHDT
jgi:hypothetical protein